MSGNSMKVIGLAGWSGSGKTTLIVQLIPALVRRGLRVSTMKHAHHAFDVDKPGKDSYEHRAAGATEVMIGSGKRWALMHELRGAPEPALGDLIAALSPCDLVLVEGFKREAIPKIEVHRAGASDGGLLFPHDTHVVAIASDAMLTTHLPLFGLEDFDRIGDFVEARAACVAAPLRLVRAQSG